MTNRIQNPTEFTEKNVINMNPRYDIMDRYKPVPQLSLEDQLKLQQQSNLDRPMRSMATTDEAQAEKRLFAVSYSNSVFEAMKLQSKRI